MTRKKFSLSRLIIHLFFISFAIVCIVPLIMVISISFTNEEVVVAGGFGLFPKVFSLDAYSYVYRNIDKIVAAYLVTILYAIGGTILSMAIMSLAGYALSRPRFILKKPMTWMLMITMFFHGGLAPSFIINTQWFHLGNNVLIYLVYGLVSAYTIFVIKAFFAQIPISLTESAALEGASEMQILTKVMLPLSKPVLATFGFMSLVNKWNDFTVSLYYITNPKLYTLPYLLQQILNEAYFISTMKEKMPVYIDTTKLPIETLKFALCVVASVPVLFLFPFFQKYFSKGMIVGAVKG